jgi:hypothetical protein
MGHGNKATRKTSFKTLAKRYPCDSAQYVVLHGFWQGQRGRKPSTPFEGSHNKHAFRSALGNLGLSVEVTAVTLRALFDRAYQVKMGLPTTAWW